ncbi:uncharacterized protein KQ657_002599 [Scheffersomyces spartinae]|uniref:DUF221-domain-containing protein n=1 Tax=Scheffersomyces spartinae TaxID=45513 RepID=A0A9P7V5Z0_9ASCO|nr:uncharacterized protein KQ657_002599 [Scheffersomyces spartinae]KAG7191992.1 hypothetical protein KQ657_002599 [Scheffersomyces spartinae]
MQMLASVDEYDNDYSALTKSYMGIFDNGMFESVLNTTQTGYAHSSSGTTVSQLTKTIVAPLCLCVIKLTLFCYLRPLFLFLYQPRCVCVPTNERMNPLPNGFWHWLPPILKLPPSTYLSMGLDTYFFIRFIHVLLGFFIMIAILCLAVLLPINAVDSRIMGLDRLSVSNISPLHTQRLNAHFVIGLVVIVLFHWMILYEFQSFVKLRHSHLSRLQIVNSVSAKTILIANVPPELLEDTKLKQLFACIPGEIVQIWYTYDHMKINHLVRECNELLDLIEQDQIVKLKKQLRKSQVDNNKDFSTKFYPPIFALTLKIPVIERAIQVQFPGFLRALMLQHRINTEDWCVEKLTNKYHEIVQEKLKLNSQQLTKHTKVFIEFSTVQGAYIAQQCLLSENQGFFDIRLLGLKPQDVLWNNLLRDSKLSFMLEKNLVTIMFIIIIILYVIPVSFIGLVSQVPMLTALIPSLSWLYALPEEIRDIISSFLPSLMLSILTEIVHKLFRFLIYFKGELAEQIIELRFQQWYFAFLFVHQFLVFTILSSIFVIFKQIIDQPTSIPTLLATNLPKLATFFILYFMLKAIAFCGNNFLRLDQLLFHYTLYKVIDKTPRQKFKRMTNLPTINWGTQYPVYSVYASIGLAFCIISPIILCFLCLFLFLVLVYYKYALKYIFSYYNHRETNGKFYPIALLQLYAGIYCLEGCLSGVFFLSRDNQGQFPMKWQGWFMVLITMITILGHMAIYNRYYPYFEYMPLLNSDNSHGPNSHGPVSAPALAPAPDPAALTLYHRLMYMHPSFRFEKPKLWLPKDPYGISERQIQSLEKKLNLSGGTNKGTSINPQRLNINIYSSPPDLK